MTATEPAGFDTVEFRGETFRVADAVAAMALMRFAKLAQQQVNHLSMEGLAAQLDLIEQCIQADDWPRFQAHAVNVKASGAELLEVVKDVFRILADRPTTQPSGSSDGLRTTEPSSTVDSSSLDSEQASRVIDRLNQKGRPDLALVVHRRQQGRLTA